jgi:hypothetical protein
MKIGSKRTKGRGIFVTAILDFTKISNFDVFPGSECCYYFLKSLRLVFGGVGRLADGVVVGEGVEEGALVAWRVGQVAAGERHEHFAAAQLLHAPPRRLKVAPAQHAAAPKLQKNIFNLSFLFKCVGDY